MIFVSLRHSGHAVLLLFLTAHNSLFIVIAYNFVHRYALISKYALFYFFFYFCLNSVKCCICSNRTLLWFHDRKYLIRSMHCIWFTIAILPIEALLHVDEPIRFKNMRYPINREYSRAIVIQKYAKFSGDFFYAMSIEVRV